MTVTNKDQINTRAFQGQCYAQATSAIKQLNLQKLRLLSTVIESEIIKRKTCRAMKKGKKKNEKNP